MEDATVSQRATPLRTQTPSELHRAQIQREELQREAALGKRHEAIKDGRFGPVLKRWVNAAVEPVSARLRLAAQAYLNRDYSEFASLVDSPLFALSATARGDERSLAAILRWCLKGTSPGRQSEGATYCDDLVLAALGAALLTMCKPGKGSPTLASVLSSAAEDARETAIGQWINQVQGPEALSRIRRKDRDNWSQKQALTGISAMMLGQVRQTLQAASRGEIHLGKAGNRSIVTVKTHTRERRITLRPPEDPWDWKLLELAFRPKGEKDIARETWLTFALLVVCCAQIELGLFELTTESTAPRKMRNNKNAPLRLAFSEEAEGSINKDIRRWLSLGFSNDPMLVPPLGGDYLTVKRNIVAGRHGPMGKRTEAEETTHWQVACDVMADTAWTINVPILEAIEHTPELKKFALDACKGNEVLFQMIFPAHKREASHEFYLPIYMDFRGRLYPRTTWVSYQGSDLQKALLCFPQRDDWPQFDPESPQGIAICLHVSSLYGGPHKLDKAPLDDRLAWFDEVSKSPALQESAIMGADEPLQLAAAFSLLRNNQPNRIAVQMDGTCNGLQHLSAMFQDEEAAPFVNLTASTYEDKPSDIYQVVADKLQEKLGRLVRLSSRDTGEHHSWVGRILKADIQIDRKLCKQPVMVLPYGGTLNTVEDALYQRIIELKPNASLWRECLTMEPGGFLNKDHKAINEGYLAFERRELADHPLFKRDMHNLAVLLWSCIQEVIPKAMSAMAAFRKIGKGLKDNALTWQCGFGETPLGIVHAYSKSEATTLKLKGLHLASAGRGLKINRGRDEIDPHKHVTGIVANFIHSQDATHLVRTMDLFRIAGGTSFGAIHDCLLCRPSEWDKLSEAVRYAFVTQYADPEHHPLRRPVKLTRVDSEVRIDYSDWYALAAEFGAELPNFGSFDPRQVIESAWFFS